VSLRKSPTLTPALLAANRRNAEKSTGPARVRLTAQALLGSQVIQHPLFLEAAELSIQTEIDICEESR